MKFLLVAINAKYIHSNPAVYSLRAYAGKDFEKNIEIAEYTINQYSDEILADIYKRKPDVIGFSCYIWNWGYVGELLAELPKILPYAKLWLGGPEVTYDAKGILQRFECLTGIMIGEGEETFKELLEYYLDNPGQRDLHGIKGLCLRDGFTGQRNITDISNIPFFYDNDIINNFKNKIIYYETSRGCPYRCSYCLSSIDKTVRFRNIDLVKKELQLFLEHQVPQVKFVDRTFNCNHEHAYAIWRYIYEHDNGVTNFHFEISADILQEDELELLGKMRAGLVQLEIGVQSLNPRTIREISRVMDVLRLTDNVERIGRGHNIHMHLDLIAGLPYEDYESFGKSFDKVYAMRPEQLQLGFLKVLKGSAMFLHAKEYGICYTDKPPYEVLYTDWLSYDDVLRLKRIEEMVEQYYNSNQYTHTLPVLEKAFSSPFAMFEALARFYEENGYFTNSPARSYRYNALLDFAIKYDGERADLYKELLTYDMYLRENLKSRTDFMTDMTDMSVKESVRNFYKYEEENRVFLPEYKKYDYRQLSKMTHLEPFKFPVWSKDIVDGIGEIAGKKYYVLFDYMFKNPLNFEASVTIIYEEDAVAKNDDRDYAHRYLCMHRFGDHGAESEN